MKYLLTMLTLTLMLFATTPDVEAKRFGGGRSYGKRYQTAPIQQKKSNPNHQQASKKSSKKGMLGGMLGGLLMGGLIASLLNGADFDGLKMMDMLILAGIAFALFKVFQTMRRSTHAKPQYATASPSGSSQTNYSAPPPRNDVEAQTAFAQSHFDIPMTFPPNFNQQNFVNTARGHYQTIQHAWHKGDLATIKPYVTPELYRDVEFEYDESIDDSIELGPLDIHIIRAQYNPEIAAISLAFLGDCFYAKENARKPIKDVWHLTRDLTQPNAPWLIVGIEDRTEEA
jgi:predicted lipid-binding transport protein (Tim44 family)